MNNPKYLDISNDEEPCLVSTEELLAFEFEIVAPNGATLYRANVAAAYLIAKLHNGQNRVRFKLGPGSTLERFT